MAKRNTKANHYPSYPEAGYDYAVVHLARMALRKPNKFICIYCHGQAVLKADIPHAPDCPVYLNGDPQDLDNA